MSDTFTPYIEVGNVAVSPTSDARQTRYRLDYNSTFKSYVKDAKIIVSNYSITHYIIFIFINKLRKIFYYLIFFTNYDFRN
ncbi:hypothetical protein J4731_01610 [Providencia rettgeri]|nr:hypothetical protein [Providencia rettgeri]